MYVRNLKLRNIHKLEELSLDSQVFNTEALMLVLHHKSFPDGVTRVFKYMDMQEIPDIMEKKEFTVKKLNELKEYLAIRNLVIPDTLVYVDDELVGFALPLIPNHQNIGKLLQDDDVSFEQKLSYVKQMGDVIQKVQDVHLDDFRFQFGDLNEYNFILNHKGTVKAIDLDSSYLGIGEPQEMIYYLLRNTSIRTLPEKYPVSIRFNMIPNDNTDLFCYHMILLKVLAKEDFSCLPMQVHYDYLDYIKKFGLPSELIESLENLYSKKENYNPKDAILGIPLHHEEKLDYKTFEKEYYHK